MRCLDTLSPEIRINSNNPKLREERLRFVLMDREGLCGSVALKLLFAL